MPQVATVNEGKAVYPLPPVVRDTAVTTPEAIVAVPAEPEPPAPEKVRLCVPFVQPALPLLLIAPPLGVRVVLVVPPVLKAMLPALVLVIVVVLLDDVAVALGFAAQAVPPHEPPIALARRDASVLVVPERTTQKVMPVQLDWNT